MVMQRPDDGRPAPRKLFESLEDRLALAADPTADFWLDLRGIEALVEQADRPIEQHAQADRAQPTARGVAAREFGLDGRGQTVVIIDSGIAYDHVALGGGLGSGFRVVGGWDFAENDADPYDDGPAGFHGTHVSGIVAAADSRSAGLATGVDLVALRVFDDQGNGYFRWVEEALRWVHERRSAFARPITTVNLSLGSQWNAATVPNWATLEEELAQLKQDGIFVAVSAGNSFAQYGAPGLSYPAASPHVVPVASVDAAGNLSRFSQRHDRALAAPGERITSTVPDQYYGGDGIKDDWGAASGTSMAAPYVAGASVLVRQAMHALGQTIVTQDGIYELLRGTADVVSDAATRAAYRRVNLQRALETLVGPDEAGDSAASARSLGTIAGPLLLSGTIGRVADADYFQFTAAQSGKLALSVETTGNMAVRWLGDARGAGSRAELDVVAGQTYTIGLSAGTIGRYSLSGQWTATENGPRIIRGAGGRVDVYGTSGSDTFSFRGGTNPHIVIGGVEHALGPARHVHFHGLGGSDWIHIVGTAAAETATIRVGSMTMTAPDYTVSAEDMETVHIVGGREDGALLYDSAGNDYFDAGPNSALARGEGFFHRVEGFGAASAFASAGIDLARLYDSRGNDFFDAGPQSGVLRGRDYYLFAGSFDELRAIAAAGGYDRANLYDSGGDDWFDAGPASAQLRGSSYLLRAEGFDEVNAYAIWGGIDQASLYGSPGRETLIVRGTSRILVGEGFQLQAQGFERARVYGEGGLDEAVFHDLGSRDQFYGRRNYGRLTSAAVATELFDFESALAIDRAGQQSRADFKAVVYVFRRLS
jgi:subtilisin family serine protease